MNVRDLRAAIASLPDNVEVVVDLEVDDGDDVVQRQVEWAKTECRCDGVPRLYLLVMDGGRTTGA